MRFIGDIHAGFNRYLNIIDKCDESIQVGDFGIGFNPNPVDRYDYSKHKFIRGNHDYPYGCTLEPNYIPDGHSEKIPDTKDDIMFCGGAYSIDYAYRTEGRDFWSDEELSYNELQIMIDRYAMVRPKVMIAHEIPQFLTSTFKMKIFDIPSRTRDAFEAMWKIHQPELWIAGHWHFPYDRIIGNTRFIILDCNSYIDLDLDGDCREGTQVKYI